MSQENVETIRALCEAMQSSETLGRLAVGDVDRRFSGLIDPDIEWDASGLADVMPFDTTEVYSGYEGVLSYWRRWLGSWRDLQFEIQDVLGAGDRVVVLIRNQRQWGRHSGILTELPQYAMVFTFRDGKVVRWRNFADHQSALKAVGLAE